MRRGTSAPGRRTYFNNPLIGESLRHLPAALGHPTTGAFRDYLIAHLHQSSRVTRQRYAEYIAQRYARDGQMNLDLAGFLARYGTERAGREVLCFELLQAVPVFQDASALWLAEQSEDGGSREALVAFLAARLPGKRTERIAKELVQAWRQLGKLKSVRLAIYRPLWAVPPLHAFLYVLARLFPEPSAVRFEALAGLPVGRALLWPRPALAGLLQEAQTAGHVSRISALDQYHQFALTGTGKERMEALLKGASVSVAAREESPSTYAPAKPPSELKKPRRSAARRSAEPQAIDDGSAGGVVEPPEADLDAAPAAASIRRRKAR